MFALGVGGGQYLQKVENHWSSVSIYGQWQPLGPCPPRLGQNMQFRVGSNDLAGPVTPTNKMAIIMMGIWKTESTMWTPNINGTGRAGDIQHLSFGNDKHINLQA